MKKKTTHKTFITTGICVLTTACMVGQTLHLKAAELDPVQIVAREMSTVGTGIRPLDLNNVTDTDTTTTTTTTTTDIDGVQLSVGVENVLGSVDKETVAEATTEEPVEEQTEEKEESVVAGYTNLGVAHVDNNLNIRKEPDENADLAGKLPKDGGCEILEVADGWAKIKSGKVTGYVKADYLYTGEEAEEVAKKVMKTVAVVNTVTLNVRLEPTVDSGILCQIPQGERVEILEDDGEWIKLQVDSDEGYISKDYVDIVNELDTAVTETELKADAAAGVSDTSVSIVQYAKQFLGNPYVWGGTSLTHGTDCSGFTMGIYRQFGISLPHSSRAQANCGRRVSTSELKPGDLLFYGNGSSISHVAMYIGGGQVIHASSKKTGIKISNAFYRSPICATRLLAD